MNNTTITIPADWDINDTTTWVMSVTVDAYAGEHVTGAIYREYTDVTYSAHDFEADPIGDADPQDAIEWWADVLDGLVEGKAAMLAADPDQVAKARTALGWPEDQEEWEREGAQYVGMDLETDAAVYRKIANQLKVAN